MFLLLVLLVLASCELSTATVSTSYSSPYPSCFKEGTTWSSQESSDFILGVEDMYSCQVLCLSSSTCHHFSWFNELAAPLDLDCFLFDAPTVEYPCSNCVSGPQSCTCSGSFSCLLTSDNFVGNIPHVETELLCQAHCLDTDLCTFYSWFSSFPKRCLMFSSCDEKEFSCKNCHSGPANCENMEIMTSTSATSPPTTTTSTTSPLITTASPYLSCFTEFTTWSPDSIVSTFSNISSLISCQEKCGENAGSCTDFTWYSPDATPLHDTCTLFQDPTDPVPCEHCLSGPLSCTCGADYACEVSDNLVDVIAPIESELFCQEECVKSAGCSFYTYYDVHSHPFSETCYLFSSCQEVDFSCSGCSSGPDDCRNVSIITTTTTTLPTTTTDFHCPQPIPQKHGDWFCPPSLDLTPETCHLECHPGYVSTNSTVILCENGVWTEEPSCVAAVALITGGEFSNTVEVYGDGLHRKLPDLPDHRLRHSLQLVNSVLLLCGGDYTRYSCITFTPSHNWEPHSTFVEPRLHHASASMMGRLYLLGGYYSGSTTEVLTPPSHQWSSGWPLIEDLYEACAAKMEPEVFLLTGGAYHNDYDHGKSAISYNVSSGSAVRLQDLTNPYEYHGCAAVRDSETGFRGVLVAGGSRGYRDRSELYDIEAGQWTVTGKLTTARDDVELAVLGQNILALGGDGNGDGLRSVDKFNLTTRTWYATEEMLELRGYHAVAEVPLNRVFP